MRLQPHSETAPLVSSRARDTTLSLSLSLLEHQKAVDRISLCKIARAPIAVAKRSNHSKHHRKVTRCASPKSYPSDDWRETGPRRRAAGGGGRTYSGIFTDVLENDVLRRVPGPGARSGDGVAPNASGGFPRSIGARGADWGEYQMRVVSRRPSTDRLSNGRPRGARRPRSVIRQADTFWRVRCPFAEQIGLAGRARSTSGREAVCRRGPRRARDRPGASRPRAHRSRGPCLTRD